MKKILNKYYCNESIKLGSKQSNLDLNVYIDLRLRNSMGNWFQLKWMRLYNHNVFFLPQFFYCLILKMCRQIIIHCGRRFIPVGVNCDSCLLFNLQKIKSKKTLVTANCRFHTWYSKRLFHQPDNIWKRNSVAWLSFGFA